MLALLTIRCSTERAKARSFCSTKARHFAINTGVTRDPETIRKELVARIRDQIGAVAAFKLVAVVSRLPKTRSGKILRGTMKKIADSAEYKVPATIDDPMILEEIAESLKELGYAQGTAA